MAQELGNALEIITVAVDAGGAQVAAPWVPADAPFRTLVDAENRLGRAVGTGVVPNGLLIDEEGVIRWRSFGGFSVAKEENLAAVRAFARGQRAFAQEDEGSSAAVDGAELAGTYFEEGVRFLEDGDEAAAVAAWRRALEHQPDNYIIRKQIWRVEHPERFEPEIDWAWQRRQRAREKARRGEP